MNFTRTRNRKASLVGKLCLCGGKPVKIKANVPVCQRCLDLEVENDKRNHVIRRKNPNAKYAEMMFCPDSGHKAATISNI